MHFEGKLPNLMTVNFSRYMAYPAWLQSSPRKPQWLQYFKLEFLKIPNVINQLVFQNKVTYTVLWYYPVTNTNDTSLKLQFLKSYSTQKVLMSMFQNHNIVPPVC